MWIFAALITSLCFGINNSIFKWSSGKGYSKVHIQFFFYFSAFILAISYGLFVDGLQFNWLSIMLGGAIGVLNANGNIQMASAFEKGPASLTSPLIAANAIFPILCAALIFHEHISTLQWTGIVCMFLATLVIQYTPNAKGNHQYVPWMMHTLLSILSFGVLGVLMTTSTRLHLNSLDILVSMYGGGTLYLLSALSFKRKNQATGSQNRFLSRPFKHYRLWMLFLCVEHRHRKHHIPCRQPELFSCRIRRMLFIQGKTKKLSNCRRSCSIDRHYLD